MALTKVNSILVDGTINTDSSGNVGIGKIPGISILDIAGEGQTGSNNLYATWSTTSSGYAPSFNLRKSNGSKASPTAVTSGDQVGALVFGGYDGTNYQNTAYIESRVDGTPGTNDMPGRLVFFTTPDGSSSPTERMRIDSRGNLLLGTTSTVTQSNVMVQRNNGANDAVVTYSYSVSPSSSVDVVFSTDSLGFSGVLQYCVEVTASAYGNSNSGVGTFKGMVTGFSGLTSPYQAVTTIVNSMTSTGSFSLAGGANTVTLTINNTNGSYIKLGVVRFNINWV
jgi:hypothetical protein